MTDKKHIPGGCILIARLILESSIWRNDPHLLKLFLYLIIQARHDTKPRKYPSFQIKRGELITSMQQIADDNEFYYRTMKKWSRAKVSRMLKELEDNDFIKILADTYGTHIKVVNYDDYQDINCYKNNELADSSETQVKQVCNASETQVSTNNNGNNGKNGKKDCTDVFNYWNSKNIITHKELTSKRKGHIRAKLKIYTIKEIKEKIDNYAWSYNSPESWWTKKLTLDKLLTQETTERFWPGNFSKNDMKDKKEETQEPKGF